MENNNSTDIIHVLYELYQCAWKEPTKIQLQYTWNKLPF